MAGELPATWPRMRDAFVAAAARRRPRPSPRARRRSKAIEAFGRSAARNDRRLGRPHAAPSSPLVGLARPSTHDDARGNYIYYGVREFGMAAIIERPRAARRVHSVRRHVPDVLRLRAQRAAHGGADEAAQRSSCSRTIRSASARTADASVGRACGQPALHPEHGRLAAVRHGRDPRVAWAAAIERADGPSVPAVLAPEPAVRPAHRCADSTRSSAAATCSPIRGRREARAVVIATGSEVALAMQAMRDARRARASPCASCRCRAPTCSIAQDAEYREACCPRCRRASRSRLA